MEATFLLMKLAEQLRQAVKASGLTKYAIAKAAGISPQVLGRFMNGERDIRLETAEALADVLGLEFRPKKKRA